MKIAKRVRQIVAANINHMLEKAEDPEKMIKQLIQEMDEHIIRLRTEVAKAIAAEKRLERRTGETEQSIAKWQQAAEKAVQDGNEDRARQVLERKVQAETVLVDLKKQHEKAVEVSGIMKKELRSLEDKIQEARRKKEILIARKRRAEAQKAMLDTSEEFGRMSRRADSLLAGTPDASGSMEALEDAVADMEAEADAKRELLKSTDDVEDTLDKEARRDAVEQELDKLKKKLKKA
jgi:phage shock protein A